MNRHQSSPQTYLKIMVISHLLVERLENVSEEYFIKFNVYKQKHRNLV